MGKAERLLKKYNKLMDKAERKKRNAELAKTNADKKAEQAAEAAAKVKDANLKAVEAADKLREAEEARREIGALGYNPNGTLIKGIAIGAAGLVVGGVLTYVLVKEPKAGDIKSTSKSSTSSVTDTLEEEKEPHKVLTDEEFDNLAATTIKELETLGLSASKEDIIKYVMAVNNDQLKEENSDLIQTIVGEQSVDEVMNDFAGVIGGRTDIIRIAYNNGEDITKYFTISNVVFDEEQKAMTQEVEKRLSEVIKSSEDEVKFNELLKPLLLDLWNGKSGLYNMESGAGYNLQVILKPLRAIYGDVLNIINDENMQILVRLVSNASDKQEDKDNCMANGYYREIYNNLKGICDYSLATSSVLGDDITLSYYSFGNDDEDTLSTYTSDTTYTGYARRRTM